MQYKVRSMIYHTQVNTSNLHPYFIHIRSHIDVFKLINTGMMYGNKLTDIRELLLLETEFLPH